jgi:hypothetical protein
MAAQASPFERYSVHDLARRSVIYWSKTIILPSVALAVSVRRRSCSTELYCRLVNQDDSHLQRHVRYQARYAFVRARSLMIKVIIKV